MNVSDNTLLDSFTFTNGALTTFTGTGMTGLLALNLSGNKFTSFDGASYTTSPSLATLNLSSNTLTSFTGTSGLSALTTLNLNSNQLTAFSGTELTSLSSLTVIDNLISTLQGITSIDSITITHNCLLRSSLSTPIITWFDA